MLRSSYEAKNQKLLQLTFISHIIKGDKKRKLKRGKISVGFWTANDGIMLFPVVTNQKFHFHVRSISFDIKGTTQYSHLSSV